MASACTARPTMCFSLGAMDTLPSTLVTRIGQESLAAHFAQPRISALFHDLNPPGGGSISWKQLSDRVAVTFLNVPEYGSTNGNSFQIELFFDGRVRLTYLSLNSPYNLVGLSAGQTATAGFSFEQFSGYDQCPPTPAVIVSQPSDQTAKVGSNVGFTVGVSGTAPLGFQWMKDTIASSMTRGFRARPAPPLPFQTWLQMMPVSIGCWSPILMEQLPVPTRPWP